ncbi:succinate dehydrogenase (ubiquinone) cytochrome b subunit precursor [Wickerhamomyces ciferrii]|uniref:Succinate dehydrogenase (Ubiquinone) cytochrome b subunit n=1 Tax=Wickerhamomyces ciferrii (strain ATCC 14091 / BCRC 22168 / CBS 111 / JCM 3599 / NBRC 0793 / NRRL Y-1031 F-60-10) TaxID=1206466 RepID=K0KC92_WICCF|nr:succinate dehydrogenase (ubiquinone) cytochrome b subunit precursor [Wickerhamomyces ciferrii]CCH40516.1 succinate dehydrogenase (ubiquinone) cytochrome b subunit precursor [Wickerhamomyces ciferrii]
MLSTRLGLGLLKPSNKFLTLKSQQIISKRFINQVTTTHEREQEILTQQRKNRPSSPHLTIYQPQLTWYVSSLHRVTGVLLAGAFYGVTVAYAAGDLFNLGIDSNSIASYFQSLSTPTQYAIKATAAFPFFLHAANGVRHLIWDAGKELTMKGVYRTGYSVLAFTAVIGTFYTFF